MLKHIATVVLMSTLLACPSALAAIELAADDRPLIELAALVVGGIGIFLIGIHFAAEHLEHMTGGRFERLVSSFMATSGGVVLLGGMLGFITQSGKAVAFILGDLAKAKLIDGRRAALTIFWGNVGCSLIAMASMLSLKVLALFVLGVTAMGLTFHVPKKMVNTYGALFGLAMIMFGLYLVKDGAAGVVSRDWIPTFIENLRGTYFMSLSVGLILTLVIQSNLAVSMLAIALGSSGLLSLAETAAIVIGSQIGNGVLTGIFSLHAKGKARQVVGYQMAFDAVATLLFVTLYVLEIVFGMPLILALLEHYFADIGSQSVVLVIGYQVLAALTAWIISGWLYRLVEAWFPPLSSESLAEPEFISQTQQAGPELNMMMIEREQIRLFQRLPLYLESARQGKQATISADDYHQAFVQLAKKINGQLAAISKKHLNTDLSESLICLTKSQEQLSNLEDYIHQVAKNVAHYTQQDTAATLGQNILESLDFLVLTALDAIESNDAEELRLLASMTQDRGPMMASLRAAYFDAEGNLDMQARSYIFEMTMLLENVVKTLSRYGEVLHSNTQRSEVI
ncbi:MAG TPA: hypothetical protein VLA24_03675 [Pseudomonadales bacterium]|nr:hypothetical protein [Pseudomonadales bacterium]